MSEKVVTKFLDFNSCNSVALCCNDFRGISIHASLMGCNHPASSGFLPLAVFQFMHPLWDATAKYSIHIPIYTIFCIYCVILSSFISFTQSYLSIHLPLLVRISQCFYVRTCILFFACPKDVGILTNCFCM